MSSSAGYSSASEPASGSTIAAAAAGGGMLLLLVAAVCSSCVLGVAAWSDYQRTRVGDGGLLFPADQDATSAECQWPEVRQYATKAEYAAILDEFEARRKRCAARSPTGLHARMAPWTPAGR